MVMRLPMFEGIGMFRKVWSRLNTDAVSYAKWKDSALRLLW